VRRALAFSLVAPFMVCANVGLNMLSVRALHALNMQKTVPND
jgi:hypothetical protein